MSEVQIAEPQLVPIETIVPYENNPRSIPPEAVAGVRESIERYGYQQPIVVDKDMVVVVGHTRLLALKEMGVTEVPVYVTDLPEDKVREYRLVDNRTSEMGQWDHSALVVELREFESSLLERFFPDVDLEIAMVSDEAVTQAEVDKATRDVLTVKNAVPILTTDVVCPACFHSFQVRTDSLPGLSRTDLDAVRDG